MRTEKIRSELLEEFDTISAPSESSREERLRVQGLGLHFCSDMDKVNTIIERFAKRSRQSDEISP